MNKKIESPIILTDDQKKSLQADIDKKKKAFDNKLAALMLKEDMTIMPILKYTNRGILAAFDFEPLTSAARNIMEQKIKNEKKAKTNNKVV